MCVCVSACAFRVLALCMCRVCCSRAVSSACLKCSVGGGQVVLRVDGGSWVGMKDRGGKEGREGEKQTSGEPSNTCSVDNVF